MSNSGIRKRYHKGNEWWSIGIYKGDSFYHFWPPKDVKNPVLTGKDVTDIDADFVADPFMVRKLGIWYMFFEALNKKTKKGEIGLATSADGSIWKYRQIVLYENFHLSYPYVFLWKNIYYMIPETIEAKEIRLYRAKKFPDRWEFVSPLVPGAFADSSVFRYNHRWWMLTTDEKNKEVKDKTLRLFYSKCLTGKWREHPQSPIIKKNLHRARSGGRIVVRRKNIVRYAQDDYRVYGNKIWAFKIMKLTQKEYSERKISPNPVLEADGQDWNTVGMHTIGPHFLGRDKWIACVDGAKERPLEVNKTNSRVYANTTSVGR